MQTWLQSYKNSNNADVFRVFSCNFLKYRKRIFMRESEIERFFIKECKKKGWIPLKFVSPSMTGLPDRIVLLPGGKVSFVELKAEGEKPRPLQKAVHRLLEGLGFTVYLVSSKSEVLSYVEKIKEKVGEPE